jgi:integrase
LEQPRSIKPDKKVEALTLEEQKLFEEALEAYKQKPAFGTKYYYQLKIELYSGMRMGEINALTPADIDFAQGVIHVNKTIARNRNGETFISNRPKTDKGIRDVPMLKETRELLKAAIDQMMPNDNNLIFCDRINSLPISTQRVNSAYKRICEKAQIKECGQHQLRHTFGTRCVEGGMNYDVLSSIMGHTDIHITIDTYDSTQTPHVQANLNKVAQYFQEMKNS